MTFKISDGVILNNQVLLNADGDITGTDYYIDEVYPDNPPALSLDFATSGVCDSRVTFTRNSTATYFGSQRKFGDYNLVWDTRFENWSRTAANSTLVVDGTVTAPLILPLNTPVYKFTETTVANVSHDVYMNIALGYSKTYTFSVYVRPGSGISKMCIYPGYQSTYRQYPVYFDLTTAKYRITTPPSSSGNYAPAVAASIQDAGLGWYKLSVSATAYIDGYVGTFYIRTLNDNYLETFTGATTRAIHLCAPAVIEGGLDTYVPYVASNTKTSTISLQTLDYYNVMKTAAVNEPRIDYDPVTGECRGLLMEETRSNLFYPSGDVASATTKHLGVTDTTFPNWRTSPEGTVTATHYYVNGTSTRHSLIWSKDDTVLAPNSKFTFSIFVKMAAGISKIGLETSSYGQWSDPGVAYFDLSTGTTSTSAYSVKEGRIDNIGNGWYRCSITATRNANTGSCGFYINILPDSWQTLGDINSNYALGAGILLWGGQVELGEFPTSYIPTTTAPAIRQADSAYFGGSYFTSIPYTTSSATLYAEATSLTLGKTPNTMSNNDSIITLGDGTDPDRISLRRRISTGSANLRALHPSADFDVVSTLPWAADRAKHKIAASIGGTTQTAFFLDGVDQQAPTTSIPLSSGSNRIIIGSGSSSNQWNGHISSIKYYNTALTPTELKVLTS